MPKLTPYKVENLRPRGAQYEVFDEGRPLAVRIGKTGTKTWTMFYRTPAGRQRRLSLGRFPTIGLADARRLCEEHLETLQKGIDPADQLDSERTRRRQAPTVADLTTAYLERYAMRQKRSWPADKAYIDRFLVPLFGDQKAAEVTRRHVIEAVETIANETPVQARRVFGLLRAIYNWGIGVDLVETSPCDRVKVPGRDQPRDRVLNDRELRHVWTSLCKAGEPGAVPMSEGTALALRLALVTGQRIGEVTGMSWFEVDRAAAWWTIPAARSKNGLEHRVPLSKLALSILARAAAIGDGGFVFAGRDATRPIDHNVIGHALRRSQKEAGFPGFTAHDLRRTAATKMASAGVPRVVLAKILNHKDRGVTAVYDRASYDPEKRAAMESWEGELLRIVGQEAAEGGQR